MPTKKRPFDPDWGLPQVSGTQKTLQFHTFYAYSLTTKINNKKKVFCLAEFTSHDLNMAMTKQQAEKMILIFVPLQ